MALVALERAVLPDSAALWLLSYSSRAQTENTQTAAGGQGLASREAACNRIGCQILGCHMCCVILVIPSESLKGFPLMGL